MNTIDILSLKLSDEDKTNGVWISSRRYDGIFKCYYLSGQIWEHSEWKDGVCEKRLVYTDDGELIGDNKNINYKEFDLFRGRVYERAKVLFQKKNGGRR